jgi:hypothetical protein
MPDTADNDEKLLSQYSNQKPTAPELQKLDEAYSPLDLVGKKFQMGQEQVANSRNNAYAMFRTDLSDEDELKIINEGATKIGPGFSQSAYEAQPWYLRAVDDAAQTAPAIGDALGQGAIGGTLAAGANLGTAGAIGAAVSRINPTAGAIIGLGAEATAFDAGALAGSTKAIWEQSAGQLYGELRQGGVSRNTSRNLAFTFGSVNAALNHIGLHNLTGIAGSFMGSAKKKALQASLSTPFVKQIEQNMVARLGLKIAGETAVGTGVAGAQSVSTELAKVVAGMAEKHKADAFTNWSSATTNTKEAMLNAIGASAILGLGAAGVGHAAGVVTGKAGSKTQKIQAEVLNQLEGKSPKELLDLMNEGLQKMPMGNETPEQQKASVQYDEQGNPYIKAGATEVQKTAPPQTTMNLPNRPIEAGQAWVDKLGQTKLADVVNDPQAIIDEGLQAIYPVDENVKHVPVEQQFTLTDDPTEINKMGLYHGTGTPGLSEVTLDSGVTKADSLFGKGVYLTSDPSIAKGYAKSRGKKTGTENVYKAELNISNPLNLEKQAPKEFRDIFHTAASEWEDNWPFLKNDDGSDTHLGELLKNPETTGEAIWKAFTDEVEDFSHQEGISATEFEDTLDRIEIGLSNAGYDALTHTGGKRTKNNPHQVVIVLDPAGNRNRITNFSEINPDEIPRPEKQTKPTLPSDPSAQLRLPLVEWRDLNPTETQARQDQIHSDIRVLKKEEANLQDQITVAEKTGKESQKLIQKWRGVTNAIDELTSESEVLDSGLTATTDQQGNNFGKIRMKKLNKIFDKMTDTVNKLEQQKSKTTEAGEIGFKKGAFKTERQIKRIQADLKNIVNVVTKDSEIRAKVRQYIAGVTTPEQAKKAIQSIKENALKFEQEKFTQGQLNERTKVFNAVQRLISAKATKVSTDKGYPVAQLPQETIEKLNVLRGYMSNEKTLKAAETSFNEQYGDVDINGIPEDAAYDLNLMRKARALYSGDKLSTNIAAAEIAQWVSDGKQLIQQKREALKAKQEQDRAEAKDSMQVPETKDVNYVKSAAKRRQIFLNESKAGWSTMRSLYKRIAPKDVASNLADKMSAKIPFTNYLRNKETTTTNFQKTLAVKLEASGSKVSLSQKLVNDAKDNLQLRFRNRQGSFTTITGNRSQFQDLVMKFRDESVHPALTDDKRGNGFTMQGEVPEGESAYEVIHSIMTKDDNTLIDGIMDFYNGDYRAYINAAYKEKHGYDLPMRDNYSPVTRVGYDVKAPYSSEGIQNYSILPGSAKTREESTLAIRPGNPVADALNHINRWEYFGAMDGKLAEIQNVLTDPTIKEHVESEYGHGTWWMIENFHKRLIMNDPIPSEAGNTLWGSLKADFTRAVLGGKHLTGALNQAASGTALWANYSPQQILHGILQTALHPVETETEIRKNPDLNDRYKSGASHELHNALNQQGLFATTLSKVFGHEPDAMDVQKHDLINKFMYAGYSAGDAAAARIFGGPIYHIERANGATPEQASATVAKLMNETQQSTLVEETPYYLTNPIVNTLLAPFSQQPTQILNLMDQHFQDFQNRPLTTKSFMKLGYQTIMLWLLPGMFTGLVRNAPSLIAPPNDDEDRTKAALYDTLGNTILGPVGQAGMLGDLAQAIWFYAAKPLIGVDETQRTDFMGRNPLSSFIINDIGGAFKEWNKLNKQDDPLAALKLDLNDDSKKEVKTALKYSRPVSKIFGIPSLLFNAPLSGIERASEGDYVGAGMALNGWSPGALNERATTDSDPLSSSNLNLKQDDSVYGNIKTYLDTYLSKQKPQKQADTNKLFIDELMKEAEKK